MKLKSLIISLLGLWGGVAALTSCDNKEIDIAGKGEAMIPMSLDMRAMAPSFATRADVADVPAERTVNTYDILVFRSGEEDVFTVHSSSSAPSQTGEDGSFTSGTFLVPTGALDLYVVANGPESAREAGTRTALLDAVSLFAANSPESFVMTASKSVDVSSLIPDGDGVRHVSGVSLERIASKVVLGKVAKAFASPALNSSEVRLLGARLVNVPKSSKVMRPSSGDTAPGTAATAYHNGTAEWEVNSLITWSPASSLEVTVSGADAGVSLYGYPNTTPEAASAADGDRVMKLVLKVSVGGTVYYYPIGIPQMTDASRNLVYRISKVTLRRPGNTDDDPTKYLEQGVVDVAMTVLDWNEATLVSDYVDDLLTDEEEMPNYFYFEALEPGSTVSMSTVGNYRPSLNYSFDRVHWNEWDFSAIELENSGDRVYFYGENNWFNNYNGRDADYLETWGLRNSYNLKPNNYSRFVSTGSVAVGGELCGLLSKIPDGFNALTRVNDNGIYRNFSSGIFSRLFYGNSALVDASALVIPSTLDRPNFSMSYLFYEMFMNCSSLISVPTLPAESLPSAVYARMFEGCNSLSVAPELPALDLGGFCYAGMFTDCTSLLATPELPATTLKEGCYSGMFSGCRSLVQASDLNALTLPNQCYGGYYISYGSYSIYGMFYGCVSLVKAPKMSPTVVGNGSCSGMFYGCTSLSDISELSLPAETLKIESYKCMFERCSSLEHTPVMAPTTVARKSCYEMFHSCKKLSRYDLTLPAMQLGEECYRGMFTACGLLTDIPELPATVLPAGCYTGMFAGCTGLVTLSYGFDHVTSFGKNCFGASANNYSPYPTNPNWSPDSNYGMFQYCTSLVKAPALHPSMTAEYSFAHMFERCSSLVDISELSLPATELAVGSYAKMFSDCSSLTTSPYMSPTMVSDYSCGAMFSGCTSLSDISGIGLPATTLGKASYGTMFKDCTSLTKAPPMAPNTVAQSSCSGMFYGCASLMDISGISLPATTLAQACYGDRSFGNDTYSGGGMFENCVSLTTAPSIAPTVVAAYCCANMFLGCTSLTDISGISLPAMTLAEGCYKKMFEGCSKITVAPELPAKDLVTRCYQYMFNYCTSLSYVKAMFITSPKTDYSYDSTYYNYTQAWLNNVASTGTFVKNEAATWDVTGANGIPSGWTVETAAN